MSATTLSGPPSSAGPTGPPNLAAKRRPAEAVIKALLALAAVLSVAVTFGIIAAIIEPAIKFIDQVPLGQFFGSDDSVNPSVRPAVLPLIMGTFMTTVIALLIAVPIGLGAAMYLSEYASKRARKWLKPTVELLAGVPSVVYGFFAVFFVAPVVLQGWLNLGIGLLSSLSAGLVLGVMIIPTVASLSEDALSAVPMSMRQGSMAMGANRMQTTLRVVVPAALSGIAAAVVLGMSRAVGETMIVLMAGGTAKSMSLDPGEGHATMTAFIAQTALGENPVGTPSYNMLYAVALLLFIITFVINMISIRFVRKFRQVY